MHETIESHSKIAAMASMINKQNTLVQELGLSKLDKSFGSIATKSALQTEHMNLSRELGLLPKLDKPLGSITAMSTIQSMQEALKPLGAIADMQKSIHEAFRMPLGVIASIADIQKNMQEAFRWTQGLPRFEFPKLILDSITVAEQLSSALLDAGTRISDFIPGYEEVLCTDDEINEITEILITSKYSPYQRLVQIVNWLTKTAKKYIPQLIIGIITGLLVNYLVGVDSQINTTINIYDCNCAKNCISSIPIGRPEISEVEKNNCVDDTCPLPKNLRYAAVVQRTRIRKDGNKRSKVIAQLDSGSFVWVVKEGKWIKVLFVHPKTDELMFGYMRYKNYMRNTNIVISPKPFNNN